MRLGLLVGILALIALIVGAGWLGLRAGEECRAAGGEMRLDGTYIYVWQTIDPKTGAGWMQMFPNSSCQFPPQ